MALPQGGQPALPLVDLLVEAPAWCRGATPGQRFCDVTNSGGHTEVVTLWPLSADDRGPTAWITWRLGPFALTEVLGSWSGGRAVHRRMKWPDGDVVLFETAIEDEEMTSLVAKARAAAAEIEALPGQKRPPQPTDHLDWDGGSLGVPPDAALEVLAVRREGPFGRAEPLVVHASQPAPGDALPLVPSGHVERPTEAPVGAAAQPRIPAAGPDDAWVIADPTVADLGTIVAAPDVAQVSPRGVVYGTAIVGAMSQLPCFVLRMPAADVPTWADERKATILGCLGATMSAAPADLLEGLPGEEGQSGVLPRR